MPRTVRRKYAFISYNHKDEKIAKWLQRKLESYKLPTEIHNEFEDSRYLRPIFRDRSDLNTGILSDELREHLYSSKYLIVICSPNSAKSAWVSREVQTFITWGRIEFIIPFVIDGTPYADDCHECFPQALLDHTRLHPEQELLGIDIREDSKEKAFIRLVSRMLELGFDDLWHRHERAMRRKRVLRCVTIGITLGLLYWFAIPISFQIDIRDEAHNLPAPSDYIFQVGKREYPINNTDTTICIRDIPGYMRGGRLPIHFSATYYQPTTIETRLRWGLSHHVDLQLKRDNTFATYAGIVFNEDGEPLADVEVFLEGNRIITDKQGKFCLVLNTQEQTTTKKIKLIKQGYMEYIREDECPSSHLQYILKRDIR
ncbi:MAG: toll/interleukin-1 receptor domain-containing protein [Alistipes sp.]|nr:toll/interleukin-1 receptor domain-containing protein [Alistipes sp.]